jgi:predicted DNA-binding protein
MRKIDNLIRVTYTVTLQTVAQLAELSAKLDKSKSEIIRDLVEKAWNEAEREEHHG